MQSTSPLVMATDPLVVVTVNLVDIASREFGWRPNGFARLTRTAGILSKLEVVSCLVVVSFLLPLG